MSPMTLHARRWALLAVATAGFSCARSDTGGDVTGPGGSGVADSIRVEQILVASGEVVRYSAGTTILAANGGAIDGDIVVDGSLPGDFTIICEAGSLSVRGRIVVEGQRPPSARHKAARSGLAKGTSLVIASRNRSRAVIDLSAAPFLRSGDGTDALTERVVSAEGQSLACGGSDAGDIIVTAFDGIIYLPPNRGPDSPPMFHLGRGGRGADVFVDRLGFTTTGTSLEIVGGPGGESGRLVLEADRVVGRPRLEDDSADLLTGGEGGRGGAAYWDNTPSGVLADAQGGRIDTRYSVEQIVMRGGDGGDGALVGGDGGIAAYWGYRCINEPGDPIASASAYGGHGGNVFPSPVPLDLALGGNGGAYVVIGNAGWPGTADGPIDGAEGGSVFGRGGDGGDVLFGVTCDAAVGGDGGNNALDQSQIHSELPIAFPGGGAPENHLDFIYGVEGGAGGDGASRCSGCPGGRGGNTGVTSAVGGDGGSVLAAATSSVGGRGGDIWRVSASIAGSGGDGNPPGIGGRASAASAVVGLGGRGERAGADGEILIAVTAASDGPDGRLCGESSSCTEPPDDDGGDETDNCWTTPGSGFNAFYSLIWECERSDGETSRIVQEWNESATLVCETDPWGNEQCAYWRYAGTFTSHDTTYTYAGQFYLGAPMPPATARCIRPRCLNGGIYYPDGVFTYSVTDTIQGVVCHSTVTYAYEGCNPILADRDQRESWLCCVTERGTIEPAYVPSGSCP